MRLRGQATHTVALMAVSEATYKEVKGKLLEAGYDHAILSRDEGSLKREPILDMSGIGFIPEEIVDNLKTEALTLRLSEDERRMLRDLQAYYAMSQSGVLRAALRRFKEQLER